MHVAREPGTGAFSLFSTSFVPSFAYQAQAGWRSAARPWTSRTWATPSDVLRLSLPPRTL